MQSLRNERGSLFFFTYVLLLSIILFLLSFVSFYNSLYLYYDDMEQLYRQEIEEVQRERRDRR